MKCIAIDDEPFALELIAGYIQKTPSLDYVEGFTNPFKAMSFLLANSIELIFIDINMPEISGLELVRSLPVMPKIIFTTAHSEYGAESYEFNAVDYLLKPFKYDRFLKAVNKATAHTSIQKETNLNYTVIKPLLIKSGTITYKIEQDDIFYIEGAGNYITIYTKSKKILALLPLNDILKLLCQENFVRIHKSYIISRKHITSIERAKVIINDAAIPIGITYREQFSNFIHKK